MCRSHHRGDERPACTSWCHHTVNTDCELVSGGGRWSSAICGAYARKFRLDGQYCWSHACRRWSVDPSRELRRFESFTCHHVLKGSLACGKAGQGSSCVSGRGIRDGVDE